MLGFFPFFFLFFLTKYEESLPPRVCYQLFVQLMVSFSDQTHFSTLVVRIHGGPLVLVTVICFLLLLLPCERHLFLLFSSLSTSISCYLCFLLILSWGRIKQKILCLMFVKLLSCLCQKLPWGLKKECAASSYTFLYFVISPKNTFSAVSNFPNNINKRSETGETLLHKACRRGDVARLRLLIQEGICINAEDHAGLSQLLHPSKMIPFFMKHTSMSKQQTLASSVRLDGPPRGLCGGTRGCSWGAFEGWSWCSCQKLRRDHSAAWCCNVRKLWGKLVICSIKTRPF